MRKRVTDRQIAITLHHAEGSAPVTDVCVRSG
jgi:hypothetical protein